VKIEAKRTRSEKRTIVRIGRPPRELAGEVETRILDAARHVFLERGLAGASVDEIADFARAGKPTIYARFPSKEALFAAVMLRNVAEVTSAEVHIPAGADIEERLVSLGVTLLEGILASNTIGLMRLGISEARRFPDLANSVHHMARERGVEAVARLLGEVAQSDNIGALPAFSPEHLATTTSFFLDLVLWPLLRRALFGEKIEELEAELTPYVTHRVAFFLAACRRGGVT
jgi:AcrR family transcriptional regulator